MLRTVRLLLQIHVAGHRTGHQKSDRSTQPVGQASLHARATCSAPATLANERRVRVVASSRAGPRKSLQLAGGGKSGEKASCEHQFNWLA